MSKFIASFTDAVQGKKKPESGINTFEKVRMTQAELFLRKAGITKNRRGPVNPYNYNTAQ